MHFLSCDPHIDPKRLQLLGISIKSYKLLSSNFKKKLLQQNISSVQKNPRNNIKISISGESPGGPVVRNPPSSGGDSGSIPGWGTKIPHAAGQLSPHASAKSLCAVTRTWSSQINKLKKKKNEISVSVSIYIHVNICIYLSPIYLLVISLRRETDKTEALFIHLADPSLSLCSCKYEPEFGVYPCHACLHTFTTYVGSINNTALKTSCK